MVLLKSTNSGFKIHFSRKIVTPLITIFSNLFSFTCDYIENLLIRVKESRKKVKPIKAFNKKIKEEGKKISNKDERESFLDLCNLFGEGSKITCKIDDRTITHIELYTNILLTWYIKKDIIVNLISRFTNLRNLTLHGLSIDDLSFLKKFKDLNKINVLNLSLNNISKLELFEQFKELKRLDLSDNQIARIENLEYYKDLSEINLNNNKIKEIKNLEQCKNLTNLLLADNLITEIPNLSNFTKLKLLSLSTNDIHEIKNLDYCSFIQDLDLHNNHIIDIKNLKSLEHLKKLDLSGNKIKKIKNLDNLNDLIELNISNNQIREIENLFHLKNLRKLNLSKNKITKLKGLGELNNLTKEGLQLNDNNFNNEIKLFIQNAPIKKIIRKSRENEISQSEIQIIQKEEIRIDKEIKIFLCHSSRDKKFVRRLAESLIEKGIKVWFDEWEMKVGDSLNQKIQRGIEECSYLAVVISPNSVNSPWVQRELNAALIKELEKKDVFVLPIYYKECELPIFLKDKVYADFRKNFVTGFNELLERFSKNI